MNYSTVYVGMDVHKETFSLCCFTNEKEEAEYPQKVKGYYSKVLNYIEAMRFHYGDNALFICGYEAGCLGFTLYHQLTAHGVKCIILAPTTMSQPKGKKKIKTDKRDAKLIARCLAHHDYSPVHIPTEQDELTYVQLVEKLERLDRRIEELASEETYKEKVSMLSRFIGVKTITALAVLTEVGDFKRFASAQQFSSYLGLTPGEDSTSDNQNRLSITKAGNRHVRLLLVEAAQSFARGQVGYKSRLLKIRQEGNLPEVIAYADKANERLRRRYYRMVLCNNKKPNVAKIAIARELACFIWGMLTGRITALP